MESKRYTLSVLVEDEPGVLGRISGLLSRRGFNIESLAVGASEKVDHSRMTMVFNCDDRIIEQVIKQLYKLINDEHSKIQYGYFVLNVKNLYIFSILITPCRPC